MSDTLKAEAETETKEEREEVTDRITERGMKAASEYANREMSIKREAEDEEGRLDGEALSEPSAKR